MPLNDFAAMRALAVCYPKGIRTNDYFRTKYPDVVAHAEERTLAKIWAAPEDGQAELGIFDAAMAPYLRDPFRGAVRRRVLSADESSLSLEYEAAQAALSAARTPASDVDLMIDCSFLPDTIGVGNAAYLSAKLGLRGASFNLETACSGSVVALHIASSLVRAGAYRNVLVVTSCTYSREADESDSLAWFLGDGAAAFLVGPSRGEEGLLGGKTIHTADTCGAFRYDLEARPDGKAALRMVAGDTAGKVLRESATIYLRTCCEGALRSAGMSLNDVDFFVFNTPTAWYAKFCAETLGIDPSRTIDTYPLYGNMGPVLMPTNLYRAAKTGRILPDDTVLLYSIGSASSASAAVMRWGDVALGLDPEEIVAPVTQ